MVSTLSPASVNQLAQAAVDDDGSYGFMIMCEQCKCWQHGPCVDIPDETVCPEIYYCEQCRPDLHPNFRRSPSDDSKLPSRVRESADSAIVSAFLSKDEQPDDVANDTKPSSPGMPMYPPTSHFAEPKNPGKRRSTMNSRDAAYEESLAAALALSQAETGTIGRPLSAQADRSRKSRSGTQEVEEGSVPPSRRRPAAASKRKRPVQDNELDLPTCVLPPRYRLRI